MKSPRSTVELPLTVEALEARLEDGYARIAVAQASGIDISAWETFWLELLAQYQAACDAAEIAEAA